MSGENLEISRRLALVERSVRRYRAALVVVGLIAAAGMVGPSLVGATKAPGTVQAKSFEVVDDNGVVRAFLGTTGDLSVLRLYDTAGKPRAFLGTTGDGAGLLTLYDKAGIDRAALGTVGDLSGLTLYDKAGKERAVLGNTDLKIPATGSTEHRAPSSLVLLNEHGNVLWEAP